MPIEVRILGEGDAAVLDRLGPDLFDDAIDPATTAEFLADPRHHLAVALDGDVVVAFVSAVHYVHPDKPAPELWIHEVGVASTHRRTGVGKAVVSAMLDRARALGCREAWVGTERDNEAARALYRATGGVEETAPSAWFTFALGGGRGNRGPAAPGA